MEVTQLVTYFFLININFPSLAVKDETESDSATASGKVFHSVIVLGKKENLTHVLCFCAIMTLVGQLKFFHSSKHLLVLR